MVTEFPAWAMLGSDVMAGMIESVVPLLDIPFTVTITFALPAARLGTEITMLPLLQEVGTTLMPPRVTVPVPWLAPKLPPVIVTAVPATPIADDRLLILGVAVKATALLATPATLTTMLPAPGTAPVGITTVMLVSLQLVDAATAPLNVTVLSFCTLPNPIPVIWTNVPGGPAMGNKAPTLNGATLNTKALLATLFTVTPTAPLEAPLGMDA